MIPAIEELKKYPNWICWRKQPHPTKEGKSKKPIISAVTGANGSHSNPADWTTYEKAKAFYILNKARFSLAGLGFVFSHNTPFVGIDLDDCVQDGQLNSFALRQMNTFKSYAEWSDSGTGIHILGKTDLTFDAITTIKNGNKIELYSKDRYFVVTGKHVEGTPDTLVNLNEPLSYRVGQVSLTESTEKEVTVDMVRDMLSYIPGQGLDYNEWLRILMSVHSEFSGADGLAAIEEWTGQFCLPNELQQKWKSFRHSGVGIGTLVHFAKEYGYAQPRNNRTTIQVSERLDSIKPKLTPVQKVQVQDVVEFLAQERAWELYNQLLHRHNIDIGYSAGVVDHLQLGYRRRSINEETGEITPSAITVPYFIDSNEVVAIEFREEDANAFTYDGEVGLFKVKPMMEEESSFGVILPDSLLAVNTYLSGVGSANMYGLPHTDLSLDLPNEELYCIFDGTTSVQMLETLNAHGVRFVKVQSVPSLCNYMSRQKIERLATRGKQLKSVM